MLVLVLAQGQSTKIVAELDSKLGLPRSKVCNLSTAFYYTEEIMIKIFVLLFLTIFSKI